MILSSSMKNLIRETVEEVCSTKRPGSLTQTDIDEICDSMNLQNPPNCDSAIRNTNKAALTFSQNSENIRAYTIRTKTGEQVCFTADDFDSSLYDDDTEWVFFWKGDKLSFGINKKDILYIKDITYLEKDCR